MGQNMCCKKNDVNQENIKIQKDIIDQPKYQVSLETLQTEENVKQESTVIESSQQTIVQELANFDDFSVIDAKKYVERLKVVKRNSIKQNQLFSKIVYMKKQKPMSQDNVFKIFETMMDKKFEQDLQDFKNNRMPRAMTEFMNDYLLQLYGVKNLATKVLSQLLESLKELHLDDHVYGNLFCRILQVYHSDPTDTVLASFLVRARIEFDKIAKIYESKEANQSKGQKHRKTFFNAETKVADVGGIAPLLEVFELIHQFFNEDLELCSNIMYLIRESNQKHDFILMVLFYKFSKIGKSSQEIFQIIDKENIGELSIETVLEGLQQEINIFLTEEELPVFSKYLDIQETGRLTELEFVTQLHSLNIKFQNKQAFLCSKAQFLTAICEEFESKRIKDFHKLKEKFIEFSEDRKEIGFEKFSQLCLSIDQNLDQEQIQEIYQKSLQFTNDENPEMINPEAFALAIKMLNIGGYGSGVFNATKIIQENFIQKGTFFIQGTKLNIPTQQKVATDFKTSEQKKVE